MSVLPAMSRYFASDEDHQAQPMMWLAGRAIYAAHFIVVVCAASLVAATLLMAFNLPQPLAWLTFRSDAVLRGEVWRVLTYGLVNPPSLWFVVEMLMIVWFGRELEKFFGRRKFLTLYACLYLLSPVLFTALGMWTPLTLAGETGGFALFIAFATLYPNAVMFFDLLAKWVAIVLVGIYTLINLADHNWVGLLSLWATTGFAFAFVRFEQGHFSLPRLRWPGRGPKLRVLPDLPAKTRSAPPPPSDASMAEIDALLDKIARSGLSSLTAKERAKLEKGRENLLRKEPPGRK